MGKGKNINFVEEKTFPSWNSQSQKISFIMPELMTVSEHHETQLRIKESSVETCHLPIRAISGGRLSATQDKDAQTRQII